MRGECVPRIYYTVSEEVLGGAQGYMLLKELKTVSTSIGQGVGEEVVKIESNKAVNNFVNQNEVRTQSKVLQRTHTKSTQTFMVGDIPKTRKSLSVRTQD